MLAAYAVHGPTMGSSRPNNVDMPFGYNFDTNATYPFPSPTAPPPPGPSILNDSEQSSLDSFFDNAADNFSNFNFPDEADLIAWDDSDLPPEFLGSSSSVSFGQPALHNGPSDELSRMSFADFSSNSHMPTPPTPAPSSTTSPEVLAAAQALRNGSNARSYTSGQDGLFGNHGFTPNPSNVTILTNITTNNNNPRRQPMYHPPPTSSSAQQEMNFMHEPLLANMFFGRPTTDAERTMRPNSVPQKVDIQWGSDVGFGSPQGFVPPPSADANKIMESEFSKIQALGAGLIPISYATSSGSNTRPPSPTVSRAMLSSPQVRRGSMMVKEEEPEPPRKRRKSKYSIGMGDEDDEAISQPVPRRRRKSLNGSMASMNTNILQQSESSEPDTPLKRRKSAQTPKATRENLTEDQKRENHIKSEQKRRTLIKEGFEDLEQLVPGLKKGGLSKSAILHTTADWLEDVVRGNQLLRRKIAEAKKKMEEMKRAKRG